MEQHGEPSRIIFHVDVNSAFLSWEAVERLEKGETLDLRTVPSAVGGDVESRHGIILAKSIPTKKYGIVTGEPVVAALRKCPNLLLVPPTHGMYKRRSAAFMTILRQYTDLVEQVSVDEAFLDMTGTSLLFGEPLEAAHQIRERVQRELGFTVNVGISSCKLLAKMASDFEKPNKVHTLFPEEIPSKMWPLPVGDLLFAGKSAQMRLRAMGVRTIGELAGMSPELLSRNFGKMGEMLLRYANGIDDSPVTPEREENKGYSHATTMPFDVTSEEEARQILLTLTDQVCARMRKDGMRAEAVAVQMRYSNLSRSSRQGTLKAATNITSEIYERVCELLHEKWDGTPVRLLGVALTKATRESAGRQMDLFDTTNYEKLERLDKALDSIRGRYGTGAVKRASSVEAAKDDRAVREKRENRYG